MAIRNALIAELKYESGLTKKMLERVPFDKKDWKPHDRSMSLGRLATHIAEIPQWISRIANINDYDFLVHRFTANVTSSTEELLKTFQEKLDEAISDLEKMTDEDFNSKWVVRIGEQITFNAPKKVAVRAWALSHLIHHRGQLSVYLRLLDVPIPGVYGPSADEKM